MYRASDLLQTSRLDKDLTLEEVAKKIKIPLKYLIAIEKEDKHAFPQEPYCSFIVKDYAEFLGLNGQRILSIFRRDFEVKNKTKNPIKRGFSFTPQLTFSLGLFFAATLFSIYLLSEYLIYNKPPKLHINWPDTADIVEIKGETDSEATIRINDDLVLVEDDGTFSKKISIKDNKKIIIESKSPSGKTTREEKTYN